MKRVDLRREVQARVGDEESALAKDSQVNRWIDLAVRTIWKAWPWSFARKQANVNTANGTATVDLASDVQRVGKVLNTTSENLLKYAPDRVLQGMYPSAETGEPIWYTDGGLEQDSPFDTAPVRKLRLYPTPDGVYTLQVSYMATPRALSAGDAGDDEYPPLPEDFDEAVVNWCLVRYYRKVDDYQSAAEASDTYNAEVGRLIEVYGYHEVDEFPRIHVEDISDWE